MPTEATDRYIRGLEKHLEAQRGSNISAYLISNMYDLTKLKEDYLREKITNEIEAKYANNRDR